MLVKTSNPSSGEFQDSRLRARPLWEAVAGRVHGWGDDFIGTSGLSSVGAVVGATYPEAAQRARELMPNAIILVPGYGTQGGNREGCGAAARADGPGIIVNASRSLMYAYQKVRRDASTSCRRIRRTNAPRLERGDRGAARGKI